MGDPHNPERIGEKWNPHRWHVLKEEIDAVREYGALSGGWAWHFMSPPHTEEKHLHDHRDIDVHVFPNRFVEMLEVLRRRGYHRQRTRFDDPSGEFIRYEKYVHDACPKCFKRAVAEGTLSDTGGPGWVCVACKAAPEKPPVVKVIFDLFIHEVPTLEVGGYTVVEPNHMLTFYGIKHSSEQCVAVQAARQIQKEGGEILKNPRLVGDWAL